MRLFDQIVLEQKDEVQKLRAVAKDFVQNRLAPCPEILGVLLTGSVGRGDARISPMGIHIDLAVVVNKKQEINLESMFGPSAKPFIPYHIVLLDDTIGIALETVEMEYLRNIRSQYEPVIFAKNESQVLLDRTGALAEWKRTAFTITEEEIKSRALVFQSRFAYLNGQYRIEKWSHREAWIQINQNFNEACECYCRFLYCINGYFIPRNDWLVYLTYSLEEKPENHAELLEKAYTAENNKPAVSERHTALLEMQEWVNSYNDQKGWRKK